MNTIRNLSVLIKSKKTNIMRSFFSFYTLISCFAIGMLVTSCSTNDDTPVAEDTIVIPVVTSDSCSNVIIVNGYAYGACDTQLEIVSLSSGERNTVPVPSDDIAFDASNQTLFVQSGNTVEALSITDPFTPTVIASAGTNFGTFSGIGAANGVVVVSGGNRSSNTQVYNFNNNTFNLTADGIALVDSVRGNPDVHVIPTTNGARAFYSQDLSAVTNWGIQIVDFNTNGMVQSTEDVVVLNSQQFTGGFAPVSPANFPVESEFLNNRLYVAHFAVNGLEVIDFNAANTTSVIDLGYQPVHITTDGTLLFTIGITSDIISILNPVTNTIERRVVNDIEQARGIAVSSNYIVIADRSRGLIVLDR